MLDISDPNALSEIGSIENRHFIDGAYVAAHASKTFSKPCPMDGQPGPEIAKGNADDIDAAVNAARRAFDDADLDKVAISVAWGLAYNAGQTCHAPTRLVVHRDLIEPLVARIKDVLDTIPVGQPLDPKAEVGAMISAEYRDRIEGYVARAITAGGMSLFGIERFLHETGG